MGAEATAILLQETRSLDVSKLKICGYTLDVCTNSIIHGIATFVRNSANWNSIVSSHPDCEVEWATTDIEGTAVANVYKPPNTMLHGNSIPAFAPPCMYAGDFNSHSTTWGYQSTNPDCIALETWASVTVVQLLFDPNQPDSFHSGKWKTRTNPYLAFANIN